jgi:hypothetical protein
LVEDIRGKHSSAELEGKRERERLRDHSGNNTHPEDDMDVAINLIQNVFCMEPLRDEF